MTRTDTLSFDALPERFRPRTATLLYGGLLVNTELAVLLVYHLLADVRVDSVFAVVYPFIWINVGLWAIVRTNPDPRAPRHRYLAGVVAGGYLLALFVLGGLLWTGVPQLPTGVDVSMPSPGIGPVVSYNGPLVRATFVPFLVVGYLALSYLVYATLIDAAGSAIGGVIGLFSCFSCVWPLIAPIFVGAFGSAGTAVATSLQSYVAGTAIFLVTIVLLYWRPFKREHGGDDGENSEERWRRKRRERRG
ncbi:DUF7546 family protein [Halalkalicoccus jeotgali]|uniref:Uncharacterized protein n=1 Tax=Halalkalicoccus jeotgali (strain DSM 18796 / CECT 7217 / JCM 14584 / KCTC 4019 / B3) TaxID=795797 RepID=D8J5J8_HALJB|nr:hypothetical protein [Halalkalicoccus jeotgali]ADJ15694.1 hypothetical protein HacjB3_11555 [Halalkalicoccus jeotgali B3]ELY36536.1 hypothetical protein C497_11093 [Halalkalicoccus jeotgali B3]